MDDEKNVAFGHFDTLQSRINALHADATRLGDADLTANVEALHTEAQAAWTAYLEARGWEYDANQAARSGGENKGPPPGSEEPGDEG